MLHHGSNCSLTWAMDGRTMHCGIISSCQSAATSETVCKSVSSCKQRYVKYRTFTFYPVPKRDRSKMITTCWPSLWQINPLQTFRAKLHYSDTGYGHHQRTSSQQFYNEFATSQCQSPTSRQVKMLGCGKFFVRWWCSLVVFVAGVRVVEFGS